MGLRCEIGFVVGSLCDDPEKLVECSGVPPSLRLLVRPEDV
jgi:hypothetical protein